jgi:nucleotide-binding universal stress UspA family protein
MFKKIAVALDGSKCSDQAFEVGLNLARAERAELGICSVVDPIVVAGTAPPSPAMELAIADMEREAKALVEKAAQRARQAGLVVTSQTCDGVAAFEIVKFAERFGADAIVMGTHGRGGLKRLFMGSVAETVLREAAVPVIVVRARERVRATA